MVKKEERALVLGGGLIAVVLLVIALWPRDKVGAKAAASDPPRAPAPPLEERTAPERPRAAALRASEPRPAPEEPAPQGEEESPEKPPPLTGLILTFPPGTPDADMQDQLAKCNVVEVRRSRQFVKVLPGEGTSFDDVKKCFRFGDVVVSEERGGPPPAPRQ